MYRFLLTPRWLGILALTLVAAAVMVLLGNWQLDRYEQRTAVNERIDAGSRGTPAPLRDALAAPTGGAGSVGPAPAERVEWSRVTATGRYDPANVVLIRGRTVESKVGFEVLAPLVLTDGTAVLVDRGWVPPAPGGAMAMPQVPALPTGEVTVVGRVHPTEAGGAGVDRRDGRLETRRVTVDKIARELPYPVHGAYLLLDEQTPANDAAFRAVAIGHANNWQNFGYVIQWWLFAAMSLFGYGWVARREARRAAGLDAPKGPVDRAPETATPA
ncbi:Cytochrome oxidase assembly protein ShyY1 [Micromonospora purpureochromogenes]|uniref:SURF1-like protein n=1 Tax=Micromonospora purpureochromogenes TaxID=47872 RepID=A0A1C4WG35_9ACTN|nr:SURF1 family protein [Micromonospora purpureochromogenes]SCE94881.1 Cytochrome oxidase assembly protein ShyY1 [Micromonospora purpureochromogenes]